MPGEEIITGAQNTRSPLTPMAEFPHEEFLNHLTRSSRLNPLRNGKYPRDHFSSCDSWGEDGWGALESSAWLGCLTKNTCSGILQEVGRKLCMVKGSPT